MTWLSDCRDSCNAGLEFRRIFRGMQVDVFARHFHRLRDFAVKHAEAQKIFGAIVRNSRQPSPASSCGRWSRWFGGDALLHHRNSRECHTLRGKAGGLHLIQVLELQR